MRKKTKEEANSRAGVGIAEHHALGREPVDVWRRDLAVRVQRADVTVSKIITQDVDEIWRGLAGRRSRVMQGRSRRRAALRVLAEGRPEIVVGAETRVARHVGILSDSFLNVRDAGREMRSEIIRRVALGARRCSVACSAASRRR